jgi:hypothetical protein
MLSRKDIATIDMKELILVYKTSTVPHLSQILQISINFYRCVCVCDTNKFGIDKYSKIIKTYVQAHPERPSSHPRALLQEMVRLLRLPQLNVRSHSQKIPRNGVRLQEMHQGVPEGHPAL